MSYEVIPTKDFEKRLKDIYKKYPGIVDDIRKLRNELADEPRMGESLGKDCYKIRIQITGKAAGKSYGARVITCVKIVSNKVYLLTMYDKTDKNSLVSGELDKLLSQLGL